MTDRLLPFAVLAVIASILTGGAMLFPAPKATAIAAAEISKPSLPAKPTEISRTTPPSKPATTISSSRPPVPLVLTRHNDPWVDNSQSLKTTETQVTQTEETHKVSAAEAKATIEADGYKNVKALVKAPDGAWRGVALRGVIEVAISVDAAGRVSAQ